MAVIDEPVTLSSYDANWPIAAGIEINRVIESFSRFPISLEHIGSTAVPGLMAKPTLDLMLGVSTFPPPDSVHKVLESLGYEMLGEAGVVGRLYFRRRTDRSVNLHVVELNGAHWRNNIAIRDLLRLDPTARLKYEAAKVAAVSSGATMLVEYSAAKAPAVLELLSQSTAPPNKSPERTRER